MEARTNVSCGLILFSIVFGLRFFCFNCQRYPQQMQKLQQHVPTPQQLRPMPATIPIQKDLLSTENRLQFQILRARSSYGHAEAVRKPLPITYSEQIKDLNRSKKFLVNRQPISRRVSDKILEPFPTRYTYSTKQSNKVLQAIMPSKDYERFREPIQKRSFEINREPLQTRRFEQIDEPLVASKAEQTLFQLIDEKRQEFEARVTTGYPDIYHDRQQKSISVGDLQATAVDHQKLQSQLKVHHARLVRKISQTSLFTTIATTMAVQSSGEDVMALPSRIRMSPIQLHSENMSTTRLPFISASPNDKFENFQPSLRQTPNSNFMPVLRPSELDHTDKDASTLNYLKRSDIFISSTATTESIIDQSYPSTITDSTTTRIHDHDPTTDQILHKTNIDNNIPQTVFMDADLADIDPADDRSDLLDIIEDRRSGNRLINFLEQRNMTLGELVEHRKRGSSQLHLDTFIQNRSGVFPDKKVVLNDGMDIVTAFENFPHFNLLNLKSVRPDEIKTDSQGSSYFTSIINIEPTDEDFKDDSSKSSVPNPKRSKSYFPSLALATSLSSAKNPRGFLQDPPQRHQLTAIAEDPVLQIEHEVAQAHDLVDLELSGYGFKSSPMNLIRRTQMSPGIRAAIVASAVIVLTSLVTFMMVFVACRWIHRRRRRKLNKIEICNAMLSSTPVMASTSTEEIMTSANNLGAEKVPHRVSRSNSHHSQHRHHDSGFPSVISLSSVCSKLETMDLSSPVVEDYLFNAMRQ